MYHLNSVLSLLSFGGKIKLFFLRSPVIGALALLLCCISSCKKEKGDDPELRKLATCQSVSPATGASYNDVAGPYTLHTAGGATIIVDPEQYIRITYAAYPTLKIDLWGSSGGPQFMAATHESLNGKHIKDRLGANRSIIFPDGAKLTLVSEGPTGHLLSVTLFDGAAVHHINMGCRKLEYSGSSATVAKWLDEEQPDGEAGSFEITNTGLKFFNLYEENSKGKKVNNRYELGELLKNEPNRVNDYFDDPRLLAT